MTQDTYSNNRVKRRSSGSRWREPSENPINLQFGYNPPQAIELEKSVLGALMMEREAFDIVAEILPVEAFYHIAHQRIYTAIQSLASKSQPVDMLTVTQEIKYMGELEAIGGEVGGPLLLMSITRDVVSGANIEAHARIIMQKFLQRELIRISGQVLTEAYKDTADVFDLLDSAEQLIFGISQQHLQSNFYTMSETMMNVAKEVELNKSMGGGITGVPSGFNPIDDVTHGWQDTDLIIIAARPSVGKTAFALNIARNAAREGIPVGVFELEMSKEQCGKRWAAAETSVPLDDINTGKIGEGQWAHFMKTGIYGLGQAKIYIDDRAGLTLQAIRSKARKMVNKYGVGLILIDYLQLIDGADKSANREQEISKISRGLKRLAKDLHVPVIAFSQLSREVEKRTDPRPKLSDLRESGAIEQDADIVGVLWRPTESDVAQDASLNRIRYWGIIKHRNGRLDEGALPFYGEYQRFENPGPTVRAPENGFASQFPANAGIRRPIDRDQDELPPF